MNETKHPQRRQLLGRAGGLGAALVWPSLALIGCTTPPEASQSGLAIDRSFTSLGQDSRIQFLVLHYTWGNFDESLKVLTGGPVSSHYLVSEPPVKVYQLVDESRRSFHAGASSWLGNTNLNASSIGIEIVNSGGRPDANGVVRYADYPSAQMDAVLRLSADIIARHKIRADRVVGHSDIAPTRKTDPGPKFPWKRFADAGMVLWPDAATYANALPKHQSQLPDVPWFQAQLERHGFLVSKSGQLDAWTRDCLRAFQMKYRPDNHDGLPDAQTAALLDAAIAARANLLGRA